MEGHPSACRPPMTHSHDGPGRAAWSGKSRCHSVTLRLGSRCRVSVSGESCVTGSWCHVSCVDVMVSGVMVSLGRILCALVSCIIEMGTIVSCIIGVAASCLMTRHIINHVS